MIEQANVDNIWILWMHDKFFKMTNLPNFNEMCFSEVNKISVRKSGLLQIIKKKIL